MTPLRPTLVNAYCSSPRASTLAEPQRSRIGIGAGFVESASLSNRPLRLLRNDLACQLANDHLHA